MDEKLANEDKEEEKKHTQWNSQLLFIKSGILG